MRRRGVGERAAGGDRKAFFLDEPVSEGEPSHENAYGTSFQFWERPKSYDTFAARSGAYRGARGGRERTMGKNKRCHHGRLKTHCKVCSPCPHGRVKYSCADCNPCPHGKLKGSCADCNPCPHGKVKYICADCNPCPHGKLKYDCVTCNPARMAS